MPKDSVNRIENEWEQTFDALPDLIAIIDVDHRIARINRAMAQRLGKSPEECIGRPCYRLVHDTDAIPGLCPLSPLLKDTSAHTSEIRNDYLKGDFIVTATPFFDGNGTLAGCLHVMRDITERIRTERELKHREEQLRNIVEHSTNAFYSHTPDHVLTYMSPRIRQILGYDPEEVMIRWTGLASDNPINREGFQLTQRAIDTGQRQPPYRLELVKKDGGKVWVEVNESPVVRQGKTVAVVGSLTDTTESTRAENALKKNEERLRLITDNMLDLITVVGLNMNVEYISPSHRQVLGYEPDELVRTWSIDFIHPDDRKKVTGWIRGLFEAGRHDAVSFRFRHADGRHLWLETVGSLISDDRGEKVGIVFSSRDITERMRSSQALRDSEAKYREILDNIDDGYYEVDLTGRFTFFNDVLSEFLGYPREELMGGYFKTAMDEENVKKVFKVFHEVYLTGVPSRLVEFESRRKDGSRAFVESSVFLIRDMEGNPVGFRGVVRDITERKKFQDRLHTMAITDQLTGLFNRRGFITLAEQQLKTADRTGKKVLLAFIDLDDMKHINDVWGHEEGDRALIAAATILKQAFRESDIIARVGGDEFAVLAPDVADTMQEVFIGRLRQQTDAHHIQNGRPYRLAMSVGSTFYDPDNPSSLDELMSRADRLMYEDKRRKAL